MSKESEFDIYVEEGKRLSYLFSKLMTIIEEVKHNIQLLLPDSEVYLFGSFTKGKFTAVSDIDLLVITNVDDTEVIDKVKAFLKRKYIDYPFEFHVVNESLYHRWYKRFIPEGELVRI